MGERWTQRGTSAPLTMSPFSKICRVFWSSALLVGAAAVLPASGEEPAHPLKPLLWKIEGKGMEKPSYLFGTIHLSKGPAANLHPAAKKAFGESDVVFTEIPLDPASQQAMVPLLMRKDGKMLGDSIGPELSAKLEAEFKRVSPQLDLTPFQPMQTWFVALLPQLLPEQLGGGKPLDQKLWEEATAAGKKTGALEKPEEQMKGFLNLAEADQVVMLEETLKTMAKERAEGRDSTRDLARAYVSGDPEKVSAEMDRSIREMAEGEHKELGERLLKSLMTDRDLKMAEVIMATLEKRKGETFFFAAGAGHICPETGVRGHLKQAGYVLTRIEE